MAALLALALAAGLDTGRLPAAPPRLFGVAWERPLADHDLLEWEVEEPGGPAVDAGTRMVVAGVRGGKLRAFQANGDLVWTFQARHGFAAPPLIRDGVVYAGSLDGNLYALDVGSGAERWRYDAKEEIGSTPVAHGDLLLVSTMQDSVVAVDAKTGAWKWHHRRDQREGFTVRGCAPPLSLGDKVIAAYSDGHVTALDPATGAPRWDRQVGPSGEFIDVDGLATDGSRLFAASYAAGVFALDPATGKTLWEAKAPGASRLLFADGNLYAVTASQVLALSPRDGGRRWAQALQGTAAGLPLRFDKRLALPTGKGLLLLDAASGKQLRFVDPGTGVSATPAANGRRLYILSNGGTLVALDLE
jgi:outer membrane protein assembly factor BamB